MHFIPLVILVVGAGTASVVVDRRLRARQLRLEAAREAEVDDLQITGLIERVKELSASAVTAPKRWVDRLTHTPPADLPQQFRAWMADTAGDSAVITWLNSLSDKGLQAFTQHVSTFCSDMGFELGWLVEQRLEANPELAQSGRQMVLNYCRACQQAAAAQPDLEVYKQLRAFEDKPGSRKHQAFGETLFAKVVEAGLVTASMSDYFRATASERRDLMQQAIREATERDQAAFGRVLKEVVRGPETAGGEGGAADAPAPA